jgi:4-hydroxy-tetrahydrodipicolinate synthase
MVGTGASSLDDSIALKRIADRLGFAAALMMPPFFYREAGDDGVMRFFDAVLSDANEIPVILYNFPKMSGITFTPSLVGRIMEAHPNRIIGIKDSSNSLDYEREMLAAFPTLRIFPGSEELLASGLAIGTAGCISGTVCLWPQLAHEVYESGNPAKAEELIEKRRAIARTPLIHAVRQQIAKDRDEIAWLRTMPPL